MMQKSKAPLSTTVTVWCPHLWAFFRNIHFSYVQLLFAPSQVFDFLGLEVVGVLLPFPQHTFVAYSFDDFVANPPIVRMYML